MAVALRQDQRQVLTQRIDPKLIMANHILQQTSLELVQTIEAELLENPALEELEDSQPCNGDCVDPANCPFCSQRLAARQNELDLLREAYDGDHEFFVEGGVDLDEDYDPVGNIEAELTLQDYLRTSMRPMLSEDDFFIGEYIINCLDENGWLAVEVDEIASDIRVDVGDVCRVLRIIQTLDPPGIAARDVQECLLIQLQFLREDGKGNALAERMIRNYFILFANRRYAKLARALGVPVEKAKQTVDFVVSQCTPRPAGQFRPPWVYKPTSSKAAVRPDVVIRRTEFGYEVEVSGTEPFMLGINPEYRSRYEAIKHGNGHAPEDERKHVTEYVERAELFLRNLNQRRKTLRMITKCIVECQQGFLETGSRAYVRPLTRTRVAEILDIHESTVSRATANKYVQLPNQEVVPFDIFFSTSLSIKTAIEDIIAKEDTSNPYSDQQIAEILTERGMPVARRTVVKYREAQKLLSSNRRRR